jgi:predicted Zn-dependent protease
LARLEGDAVVRYALALERIGRIEQAESVLARAVDGDEASPLAPRLEQLRTTIERINAMRQEAAALLTEDPGDPDGLKMQAQIQMLHGQALEASYLLHRLLREEAADFAVWVLMGCAKAQMDAAVEFLEAWPTPPPKPDDVESAWIELARTCAAKGLWDAARTYLESPAAVEESEAQPLIRLAEIAEAMGRPQRATALLREATEAYPESAVPWLRLCDLALAAGQPEAAQRFLSEAEKRGASQEQLGKRREPLGEGEEEIPTKADL